ncbi:MAG TPA: NADP oxidoreductase [Kiritimatiellia bacterium]|nr:NADP oxidoreductase [Kiritimatiellia bacterium]
MNPVRIATIWLDGCSGCHMSFLDIDELLLDLAGKIQIVYSPLVDRKDYPENVDVVLIEGAVSTPEDVEKLRKIRKNTKIVVALGDCAVTANVPGMRNNLKTEDIFQLAYFDQAQANQQIPIEHIPPLLARSIPVHHIIPVDLFLPGCPPSAPRIAEALVALLEGRDPAELPTLRFG